MRRTFLQWILPLFIFFASIALAFWFITKAPKSQRKAPAIREATIVETTALEYGRFPVIIETMGEVIPARKITVNARVSGELVSVSPNLDAGKIIKKGEVLALIDDRDYHLTVDQRTATVEQAQSALDLELGQQNIAREELKLLEQASFSPPPESSLALRKPQLASAQAELRKAQSLLEEAQINLERTTIYAPWDALVLERNVSTGMYISSQTPVATIVDYSEYWINATISSKLLPFLKTGKAPSTATINLPGNHSSVNGYLHHISGELETDSRLVPIVISVPDPLGKGKKFSPSSPQLILGDYRKVSIEGNPISDVFRVSRKYIRDGNTIWLMRDSKLLIESITPVHEDREYLYFQTSRLSKNEELVTSSIPAPVENMKLRKLSDLNTGAAEKSGSQDKHKGSIRAAGKQP